MGRAALCYRPVVPPAEAPAQGVVAAQDPRPRRGRVHGRPSFVYVLFQPSMDPPSFLFADGNKYRHCGDSFLDMVSTVCEKVRAKLEETIDSALNPILVEDGIGNSSRKFGSQTPPTSQTSGKSPHMHPLLLPPPPPHLPPSPLPPLPSLPSLPPLPPLPPSLPP